MIFLGADHRGYKLKEGLKIYLDKKGIPYKDLGTNSELNTDYPDYAKKVARKVKASKGSKGILICGSGTGMTMSANRFKGIRASLAYDNISAKSSRRDEDSNIICLNGNRTSVPKAEKMLSIWLGTPFSKLARYKRRIKKLDNA